MSLLIFQLLLGHLLEKMHLAWEARLGCRTTGVCFQERRSLQRSRIVSAEDLQSGTAQYKPPNPPKRSHSKTVRHKATIFSLSGRIFNLGQHFILGFGSAVEVELLSNFWMLDGDLVLECLLCGHVAVAQ